MKASILNMRLLGAAAAFGFLYILPGNEPTRKSGNYSTKDQGTGRIKGRNTGGKSIKRK